MSYVPVIASAEPEALAVLLHQARAVAFGVVLNQEATAGHEFEEARRFLLKLATLVGIEDPCQWCGTALDDCMHGLDQLDGTFCCPHCSTTYHAHDDPPDGPYLLAHHPRG